jgi:hypothetical protein
MRGGPFRDGKLVVVEDEAEQVRLIFRRYLEVSGINELVRDLKERDVLNQGPLTRLRLGCATVTMSRDQGYMGKPGRPHLDRSHASLLPK